MFTFISDYFTNRRLKKFVKQRTILFTGLDDVFADTRQLEEHHVVLMNKGKTSTDPMIKRRCASEIARLRSDMRLQQNAARIINAQISVISTQIQNQWLAKQTRIVPLPDAESLLGQGADAEVAVSELSEIADVANSLSNDLSTHMSKNEDEENIFKELGGAVKESGGMVMEPEPPDGDKEPSLDVDSPFKNLGEGMQKISTAKKERERA